MSGDSEKYHGSALEDNLKKALTELIILFLLSEKECYIGELTAAISIRSHGVLSIVFPYGAIYRLQQSGYIMESQKRNAPDGRRRQYLQITASGHTRLLQLLKTYWHFSKGVADLLGESGGLDQ